jgi:hypothetical protein
MPVNICEDRGSDWSILNIYSWGNEVVRAASLVGGSLSVRLLRANDLPLDVIACVNYIDVPPGTPHQDVACLLIEQLLRLSNLRSDVIDRWRESRGVTPLMERLRKRLIIELESLRVVTIMGLHRDLGEFGSKGDALMARRRRSSGIPRERRNAIWRIRKVWYGLWSA